MKFELEGNVLEHTFVDPGKKGVDTSWFKELHRFFKEDYFINWIHNINISQKYSTVYPTNITKIFSPLNANLDEIKVIVLFNGNSLNIMSNGIGPGENRAISVPDMYLSEELRVFKTACINHRIENTTADNCCEITPDYDHSLGYLVDQDVLLLNVNAIKSDDEKLTKKLSNYFLPIFTEIIDSVILKNDSLRFIIPEDVDLKYYSATPEFVDWHYMFPYKSGDVESLTNALNEVNRHLKIDVDEDDSKIIKW